MAIILTIKEQAHEIIMKKILTQEYPLGARINIGQLSKELGISNSPIREALTLLEKQGLVVSTPNSGISVADLTKRDRYELAQTLLFLVAGAYEYCVKYSDINALCDDIESVLALQRRYLEEMNEYEFTYYANRFTRCIVAATGNRRLLNQFDDVFPLFFLGSLYGYSGSYQNWLVSFGQNKDILQKIRSGRHDEVVAALTEHYYRPDWDLRGRSVDESGAG